MNIQSTSSVSVSSATINNCSASLSGGAVYAKDVTQLSFGQLQITNSVAKTSGGVHFSSNSVVKIDQLDLIGNQAEDCGGGTADDGATVALSSLVSFLSIALLLFCCFVVLFTSLFIDALK